jgi:hypothetical protein
MREDKRGRNAGGLALAAPAMAVSATKTGSWLNAYVAERPAKLNSEAKVSPGLR